MSQRMTKLHPVWVLFAVLAAATPAAGVVLRDGAGVSGQEFGAGAALIPDLDGDGRAELLVGSPSADAAGLDAGRAYLWLGGVAVTADAAVTWSGQGGEELGRAVAAIGDVNDDGVGDFAIGAPLADAAGADAGRVYVFYGGWPLPGTANRTLEGRTAGEHFGHAIAGAGDVNGDGRDDLLVGAPWNNGAGVEAGAVYVYYGSASGLATTPSLTFTGTQAYERFGWSVARAGNFLGGTAACIVAGAPSNGTGALTRQGAAYVFAGSTSPSPGPDTTADLVLHSNATSTADNEFGYAVALAGRWSSDSYDDLVIGAPYDNSGGSDAGRAEVFFGGLSPDAVADRYVNGAASGDWLGFSVAGVANVTGTGADDVVLGGPHAVAGLGSEAGLAVLYAGGSASANSAGSLPQIARTLPVPGTAAGDHFGWWVAGGADFDGDGTADYLVAAPAGNTTNVATAGWVQVYDSSGDAVPALLTAWEAMWAPMGAELRAVVTIAAVHVTVTRTDILDGRRVPVYAGAPPAGSPWIFHDDGAAGPVRYDLALTLADGGTVVLDQLAGPAGDPPRAPVVLTAPQPNPFNPSTTLRWRAPAGEPVTCRVVDLRGRHLRTLLVAPASGAWSSVVWDGTADDGRAVAAGVYVVRLETAGGVAMQRAVLAK